MCVPDRPSTTRQPTTTRQHAPLAPFFLSDLLLPPSLSSSLPASLPAHPGLTTAPWHLCFSLSHLALTSLSFVRRGKNIAFLLLLLTVLDDITPLPNPGDRHVGVRGAVDRRLRCGHGCAVRPQQDSQVAAGAHPPRCLRGLTRLQRRQPCSNPGKENRQDSSSACDVEGPVP